MDGLLINLLYSNTSVMQQSSVKRWISPLPVLLGYTALSEAPLSSVYECHVSPGWAFPKSEEAHKGITISVYVVLTTSHPCDKLCSCLILAPNVLRIHMILHCEQGAERRTLFDLQRTIYR